MAKEDNLKKFSSEYQPEKNGRPKGAKNRSTIAKYWLEVNQKLKNPLTNQEETMSQEDLMTLALIKKAREGDVAAYKALMDSGYGAPLQQVEQTIIEQPLFPDVQGTTATNKVLALKRRIKIIQGGTSASKTYSILAVLIDKAIKNPNLEISIVAESIPHLRRGALKDFVKILKWTNRYNDNQFNKSLLTYQFKNGSSFEFFSADDSSKLRGARRDILYINECNNITFESYNELAIRTKKEVYLDFNPANEFWVHTELKDEQDSDFLILTYKDNEALDNSIVQQIEKNREKASTSAYWGNWWRVYGLGEIGMLEGVIFSNWKQIDTIPQEAKLIGIGLDFGYTNDPTAIVEIYNYNGTRIINELVYKTGMLNSDIAKILPDYIPIYADSSEPKSIDEIRRYGKTIKGVTKGKDSINYGIDVIQQQEYLVTSNSVNLIKELRAYCWDVDKSGTRLNKPIDNNNHAIDAFRYHEMETLGIKRNYGTYNIH